MKSGRRIGVEYLLVNFHVLGPFVNQLCNHPMGFTGSGAVFEGTRIRHDACVEVGGNFLGDLIGFTQEVNEIIDHLTRGTHGNIRIGHLGIVTWLLVVVDHDEIGFGLSQIGFHLSDPGKIVEIQRKNQGGILQQLFGSLVFPLKYDDILVTRHPFQELWVIVWGYHMCRLPHILQKTIQCQA
jgi:hypothetical protein